MALTQVEDEVLEAWNAVVERAALRGQFSADWKEVFLEAMALWNGEGRLDVLRKDVDSLSDGLQDLVHEVKGQAPDDEQGEWNAFGRSAACELFNAIVDGMDVSGEAIFPLWMRDPTTPARRKLGFTPNTRDADVVHLEVGSEVEQFLEDLGITEDELKDYRRVDVAAEARRVGLSEAARRHVLTFCSNVAPAGKLGVSGAEDIKAIVAAEIAKAREGAGAPLVPSGGIAAAKQRLTALSMNPAARLRQCLDHVEDREDWPLAGTQYSARLAGEYLARVYASGLRATEYYRNWSRQHFLENCKAVDEVHFLAAVLDGLLLVDQLNVANAYGCELLARRLYGFELVFANCTARDHWKRKARWKMLEVYDASALDRAGPRVGSADAEARKALEVEASFAKWLAKAPAPDS